MNRRIATFKIQISTLLLSLPLACAVGCSDSSSMGDVRGTVTLDGKPLASGDIRFAPVDGQSGTAGGFIKDGTFETRVPIATHRVEISAVKAPENIKISRHSDAEYTVQQLIPEKYNTKSTLTIDVKPGLNEPQFNLESR